MDVSPTFRLGDFPKEDHIALNFSNFKGPRSVCSHGRLALYVHTTPTKELEAHDSDMSNPVNDTTARGPQPRLPVVLRSSGHYVYLNDGRDVLDACGGAGVTSIGHGNSEVISAITTEINSLTYVPWTFFDNRSTLNLSEFLTQSTGGRMTKVYLTSSGSEAVEAAIKLAREYFIWKGQPQRTSFIAREESYHGTTIGSLSVSGHLVRRAPFEDILLPNIHRIPACNAYRQQLPGETDTAFVARKADELDRAFQAAGPQSIAAFIAEPVVGAALGCITAPTGYFRAMKMVCDKYGALLILDEVMCGMGRTGTLHAWEQEQEHAKEKKKKKQEEDEEEKDDDDYDDDIFVPDIQCVGKGLAGGYLPCSGILVHARVMQTMEDAGAVFNHGHTFQNHAAVSAAALAVQRIIQRDGLLANVRRMGLLLEGLLRERLGGYRFVGDIRGRGLFWGVEFVKDRKTKEPFDPVLQVARLIHEKAMKGGSSSSNGNGTNGEKKKTKTKNGGPMMIYYGQGCAGNKKGDHIMIMPAYTVDERILEMIIERLDEAVRAVFDELWRGNAEDS